MTHLRAFCYLLLAASLVVFLCVWFFADTCWRLVSGKDLGHGDW